MSDIENLLHKVVTAVARASAAEGILLGVGKPIDGLVEAAIRVCTCRDPHAFAALRQAAFDALTMNWSCRIDVSGYDKSAWLAIDAALMELSKAVAISVRFGSSLPITTERSSDTRVTRVPTSPARSGDHYRFTYLNEPRFDKTLLVVQVAGDGPEDLVFFEDHSHSKQKDLNKPGAERVSP